MSARKPIVGGNWKMNLNGEKAQALAAAVAQGAPSADAAQVAIFPPFPYLNTAAQAIDGSPVMLGAQDFYHEGDGAFTGEVSLAMLQDLGVSIVLTGHSERRHVIGEPDTLINEKTLAALEAGLHVILCVGEKIEQREAGKTHQINMGQLEYGLAGVSVEQMERVVIAYEPVWAIGTGKTATPEDAQEAHLRIRNCLKFGFQWDPSVGDTIRIQYGGSVKPDNAATLFGQADIDGGLIGGASLKPADYQAIVDAAANSVA